MAVVQISRIQIRRGRKNSGTGLPQLASGEIAWAIDTQELYIGNGAVSEGSPYVGNTKVLTEHDSLLDLAGQYQYRKQDANIITGVDATHPIVRSLQQRLDERVTVFSFGVENDGIADVTVVLQQAINQIFLNPATLANTSSRIILEIPAGTYKISNKIYIPCHATIIGAGVNKTFIEYIGSDVAFAFVNTTATPGSPSSINTSTYNNQAQNITLKGMTIHSQTVNKSAMVLDAVRDSVFEDLLIRGDWNGTVNDTGSSAQGGLQLNALSALVTCQRNIFKNVTVNGFTYGLNAKQDILSNRFENCHFENLYIGSALGRLANLSSTGEQYGPRNTTFDNCRFVNILREAVYVYAGRGNTVSNGQLTNVGNDSLNGNGNEQATYTQIRFITPGNSAVNNFSDRSTDLSTDLLETAYIGEVSGIASYSSFGAQKVVLGQLAGSVVVTQATVLASGTGNVTVVNSSGMAAEQSIVFSASFGNIEAGYTYYIKQVVSGTIIRLSLTPGGELFDPGTATGPVPCTSFAPGGLAFRLPIDTDSTGYVINYLYRSTTRAITRRGTMTVIVDTINKTTQLTDEYDFVGTAGSESALFFTAKLLSLNGANRDTLGIYYTNTSDGDVAADFIYSYSAVL